MFSKSLKSHHWYIWATFMRKFVTKNIQNSHNLVTLLINHDYLSLLKSQYLTVFEAEAGSSICFSFVVFTVEDVTKACSIVSGSPDILEKKSKNKLERLVFYFYFGLVLNTT